MKKIFQCLIASLLFFALTIYAANNPSQIVTSTLSAVMKENNIPGAAVLLYVNGEPQSYFFGNADPDKKIPISKRTIFEIGSLSKLMTSLLLAQQVDAAKVQLEDSLTTLIPDLPNTFDEISLKNLATHTSGLPFAAPSEITNQTTLIDCLKRTQPNYAVDEKWTYSNFGIGLLGFALETSTHKNENQLYRTNILSPLGMQAIGLTVPDRLKRFYARGYDQNNHPVKATSLNFFSMAWGIKASAEDMQHFLAAAIGLPGTPQRIFYPMRMTQTAYIKLPNKLQGLGWEIYPLDADNPPTLVKEETILNTSLPIVDIYEKPVFSGDNLIDKTGATEGFRAYIAVIPNKKTGIVILMNKNVSNQAIVYPARKILFDLLDMPTRNHDN